MTVQALKDLKAALHNAANPVSPGAIEGNLERALGLVADLEAELAEHEALLTAPGLTRLLKAQIRKAFDNQAAFLDRFCSHGEQGMELMSVYMASEGTHIALRLADGSVTYDIIETEYFIDWTPEEGTEGTSP